MDHIALSPIRARRSFTRNDAASAAMSLMLGLGAGTCLAGNLVVGNISIIDENYTTTSARNIGSCLALVGQGANQPRRLLVGMAGSNNSLGQIQVGRTIPLRVLSGGDWDPLQTGVTGSPTGDFNNGYYGYRCRSEGDRHIVSQRNGPRAHVYRDGVLEQTLLPTLNLPQSQLAPDVAVDIRGSLAVLGVPNDNSDRGRVHVWQHDGVSWQFRQVLDSGASAVAGGQFGWSVALTETALLVGAPAETTIGRVHVFDWNGTSFQPRGTLATGSQLDAAVAARFGHSIAVDRIDEQALFVGAPGARLLQFNRATGTALAYRANAASASGWDLQYASPPIDWATSVAFGTAVALRNRTLLVSDPRIPANFGSANSTGVVYRYRFNANLGMIESLDRLFRLTGGSDQFGWSLEFQDEAVAIGAPSTFTINPQFGNVYLMGVDVLHADGFE